MRDAFRYTSDKKLSGAYLREREFPLIFDVHHNGGGGGGIFGDGLSDSPYAKTEIRARFSRASIMLPLRSPTGPAAVFALKMKNFHPRRLSNFPPSKEFSPSPVSLSLSPVMVPPPPSPSLTTDGRKLRLELPAESHLSLARLSEDYESEADPLSLPSRDITQCPPSCWYNE